MSYSSSRRSIGEEILRLYDSNRVVAITSANGTVTVGTVFDASDRWAAVSTGATGVVIVDLTGAVITPVNP